MFFDDKERAIREDDEGSRPEGKAHFPSVRHWMEADGSRMD